ncbi:MAG TPA: right-handed parallel beta-helix repeat-containing protein [Terracidiphilus sp.]|nr:right-handed parallel beta-helix repeat-containing protein [Terracidiphilus sp.]
MIFSLSLIYPAKIHPHKLRLTVGLVALICSGALAANAATLCVNPGGTSGCKTTITAAVNAAMPGDTVLIAPGTYAEEVVIKQSISLMGTKRATVIDASGLPHGIFIDGMASAPAIGVSNVVVSGITVRNANFEGILMANASDVSLTGNQVMGNDKALDASGGTCSGLDTSVETNEELDCGEGIHLMGVEHSTLLRNEVAHNAGGILISDETGPNGHNLISENFVHDNVYDCGITLASHGRASSLSPGIAFGVGYNTISRNISMGNGTKAAGAGVGIFAPGPGNTNTGNVVIENIIRDNGATGVAMHNHAAPGAPAPPGAPPVNLNDNVIVGNWFSGNGPDNPGAPTPGPTAINIFSKGPITGTVISQNNFANEAIDVGYSAPTGQVNVHFNDFSAGIAIRNVGSGTVDATENWWNCPKGPGGTGRCATVMGSGVTTEPWLNNPFEPDPK